MVGVTLSVFIKRHLKNEVHDIQILTVPVGVMGMVKLNIIVE